MSRRLIALVAVLAMVVFAGIFLLLWQSRYGERADRALPLPNFGRDKITVGSRVLDAVPIPRGATTPDAIVSRTSELLRDRYGVTGDVRAACTASECALVVPITAQMSNSQGQKMAEGGLEQLILDAGYRPAGPTKVSISGPGKVEMEQPIFK